MGYGDAFEGVFVLLKVMAIVLLFTIPLGLWKLVEIIIWLTKNVHIG